MRIVLTTCGSRGDVQPMLALSLALQSAGHDILFAGPPEKASWARHLKCPYQPFGTDVTALIDDMDDAHSLGAAVRFISFLRKELVTQFEVLPGIISGADVVVGSSLVLALSSVAESMGTAYRYIAFTPQLLPSGYHPAPVFRNQSLPRWCNRITWKTMKVLDRWNLTRIINKERKKLGLNPTKDAWLHALGQDVIVASDSVIGQIPPDVAPRVCQTGYMHLDQPEKELPELNAFLESGPAPVYAGFGSMPKRDQARNVPLIVAAARSIGQRVIIAKFWDEPSEFSDARDVFFIKKFPHLRLFPLMAAVVHHGGAGTTASGAISGVPQIIVPHILDQYYWGRKVHESNLGPKPIGRSKLTARRLAAAIRECLSNDLLIQTSKAAADVIKGQDSIGMTVAELET
ncbi:MAG: glycosyltransferase family 1 protein [Deltaproteobacteria bacterium]|nr:glycosyltransferase family 1 protein [Deltaproteobacteria bacterium]MBW2205281.1 glycosyltransferase family 1 protein [Deltaproteobacteria bacterium]